LLIANVFGHISNYAFKIFVNAYFMYTAPFISNIKNITDIINAATIKTDFVLHIVTNVKYPLKTE